MSRIGMDSRQTLHSPKTATTTAASLRSWVSNRLGSIRHERRVITIATALFDSAAHIHNLTASHRRLLRLGALVHDVGRSIDDKRHPAIGAKMLMNHPSLPLKRRQRRALAYLTFYHRGQVPALGKDMILRDSDDREGLLKLLGFLRAADCLDSRALPSPDVSITVRNSRVRIHCRLPEESPKARRVYTRRKKFRLLEETLGCDVNVTVECGRRLRMVA